MKPALRVAVAATLLSCLPAFAAADERYAIVISGATGGGKYAEQQKKWLLDLTKSLEEALAFPDANVLVLSEDADGTRRATARNVERVLADVRRRVTSDDTLILILLGHGTFDGEDAKFNLAGPDLTARDWASLLEGIAGRVVVVNTTESSFPFLEQLSARGRVVITATDSAAQRFATVFPEYFIKSIGDPASDFDKNGRVSIWEAFTAASATVKEHYEQKGQLSTERPLLDDDGDRNGREAQAPGEDGVLARTVYLDPAPGTANNDAALAALERRRDALQMRLEELKARKPSMPQDQYETELENLLIQLSRVTRQIRQRS